MTEPEDLKDLTYAEKVEKAIRYMEGIGGDAGLPLMSDALDRDKIDLVLAEAGKAQILDDELRMIRVAFKDSEQARRDAETRIKLLEDRITEQKVREATHAGMCSAFQTALIAVGQGFSSGKS